MLNSITATFEVTESLEIRLRGELTREEEEVWRQAGTDLRYAIKRSVLDAEEDESKRAFRVHEIFLLFNIESFEVITALQEEEKLARLALRCDLERATLLTSTREAAALEKEREPRKSIRAAGVFNRDLNTLLRSEEEGRAEVKGQSYGEFFDLRSLFSERYPRGAGGVRKRSHYITHTHAKNTTTPKMSAAERLVSAEDMFRHTINSSEKLAFNKLMWNAEQSHTRVVISLVKLGRDYEYFGPLLPKRLSNAPRRRLSSRSVAVEGVEVPKQYQDNVEPSKQQVGKIASPVVAKGAIQDNVEDGAQDV